MEVIEHQVSDIHFQLIPLTREDLIEKYGKESNPFIDYPGKLPRKFFLIFDTVITTEQSEVEFSRDTITVTIGNSTYKTLTYFSLQTIWNAYDESDRASLHRKKTIMNTLKPSAFSAGPVNSFKGTLAFLIPLKEDTKGVLHIPAKTPEGDEGVIDIPFTLEKYIDGEKAVPSENTGIFAQ